MFIQCTAAFEHEKDRTLSMYVLCICNEYVMFIYLYSTACPYNKSSEGVNRFCCSWAESHPPKPQHATYCCHGLQQEREACWAMKQPVETSFLLALQAFKKLVDGLLCIFSIWPGIKKSPSSGQGLPPSILSREAEGRGMSLCPASASLCRPWKPVETTGYTMYIHCTYIVHTWFIHWHTMYMCTVYSMLVPQRQFPLWTRL